MSVVLKTRKANDVSIVDISGRLTLGEGASALRHAIRELSRADHKKILLNLGDVTYMDSSGMGMLVSVFATVTNQGGQLKLMNVTSRVKDLLLITKLYTVFEIYDNEQSALRSFLDIAA
jgi:anti-sigma B factor antagonist